MLLFTSYMSNIFSYLSLHSQVRSTQFRSSFLQAEATSYDYDLIIVGCGVGGHGAALHARANGLKTAVLTGYDVGGTCVNRGCVPSKALLAAAGNNKIRVTMLLY